MCKLDILTIMRRLLTITLRFQVCLHVSVCWIERGDDFVVLKYVKVYDSDIWHHICNWTEQKAVKVVTIILLNYRFVTFQLFMLSFDLKVDLLDLFQYIIIILLHSESHLNNYQLIQRMYKILVKSVAFLNTIANLGT